MRFLILAAFALGSLYVKQAFGQSASCAINAYSCPSEDLSYAEGVGGPYYNTISSCSGSTLTCAFASADDPGPYYCLYSQTTGDLTMDEDSGYCELVAVPGPLRRSSPGRSVPSGPRSVRASQPKRAMKEAMGPMVVRRVLGQKKSSAKSRKT